MYVFWSIIIYFVYMHVCILGYNYIFCVYACVYVFRSIIIYFVYMHVCILEYNYIFCVYACMYFGV